MNYKSYYRNKITKYTIKTNSTACLGCFFRSIDSFDIFSKARDYS